MLKWRIGLLLDEGVGDLLHAVLGRNQHHRRAAAHHQTKLTRLGGGAKWRLHIAQLLRGGVNHQIQELIVA